MKKILFLSDVDISVTGGAQESMKIIMDSLISKYDFHLLTPAGKRINKNHMTLNTYNDFILRGKNPLLLLRLIGQISKKIKEIKPDLIHIQMPSTMILINFMILTKQLDKKVKIVYTDRGVYGKYGKLTTKSINALIKRTDKIVTTTNVNKENYKNLYNKYYKYEDKFTVIPNTAGGKYESLKTSQSSENELVIPNLNDYFVIGFCGRFTLQKNWPMVASIMKELKKHKQIKFLLAIGSDNTKENLDDINNFIENIKLDIPENRVEVFIDIPNSQMPTIYEVMDVFILTSSWESFGRTAVEAMAKNNVVFGTNVDGITEVIGNQYFVYEKINELIPKIVKLYNNQSSLGNYKKYFNERYYSEYSIEKNIKSYDNLYKEILGE